METNPDHVVLGTGPLGLAVVRALGGRDESVRVVNRSGEASVPGDIDRVAADMSGVEDACRACDGASVVYFCVQPPYGQWPELFPTLLENAIAGAERADARLVVAENCYMYGPVDGPLTEDLPYDAVGRKGRTRAAMARMAIQAHEDGRLEVAVGRASDFYGPHVTVSMVGERVFTSALAEKPAYVLGDPDTLHTYTFIDDFGQALVRLGDRPEAAGEAWHVPSAETMTTRRFVELVYERAGNTPRIRRMPSWLFRAVSTVSRELRELRETSYQFEEPFVVDHSKFEAAFGADPTPHETAIDRTLDWYRSWLH